MANLSVRSVVSVDVEDYFQVEAFADVVERSQWGSYTSRVTTNTHRLLDLFAARQIQATFFVVGWVAERFPALVREIAAAGHELACHSYWHRLIYNLDPAEFREDTRVAKTIIEQIAGQAVYGYRAPSYSIVGGSLWALEVLVELGFTYDSSIFPIHHDVYGIPAAPRGPFRVVTPCGPLLEYPITTFRLRGHNLPVGGGGYLRILPEWYSSFGIKRVRREGLPVIAYIHPWEIDPEQPRLHGRLSSRFRHYTNLSKAYGRLNRMLLQETFTSFRESGLSTMAKDFDLYAFQHKN
jgi:polysaccharide deacetylase family protein (PEP-CTERM system associated)